MEQNYYFLSQRNTIAQQMVERNLLEIVGLHNGGCELVFHAHANAIALDNYILDDSVEDELKIRYEGEDYSLNIESYFSITKGGDLENEHKLLRFFQFLSECFNSSSKIIVKKWLFGKRYLLITPSGMYRLKPRRKR